MAGICEACGKASASTKSCDMCGATVCNDCDKRSGCEECGGFRRVVDDNNSEDIRPVEAEKEEEGQPGICKACGQASGEIVECETCDAPVCLKCKTESGCKACELKAEEPESEEEDEEQG